MTGDLESTAEVNAADFEYICRLFKVESPKVKLESELAKDNAEARRMGLHYGAWRTTHPTVSIEIPFNPRRQFVCQICGKVCDKTGRAPQKYCSSEACQKTVDERKAARQKELYELRRRRTV